MDAGYQMHVISHTHWDREWYLPFQRFRLRLVDLIDHLLALLDRDPDFKYFNLDGQTIVLEDYLQIRPENEARLRRYIREGRILVGPWYQLNDQFLVSGEATVRSLLIGSRIAADFGAVMPVGYLPDQFGNISQMPQILRGFGIDACIFGRGLLREGHDSVDFVWRGADGSTVLANFLAFWYNNLQRLPEDPEAALAMTERARDLLAPLAKTPNLLLMNGVDHLEAQDNLSPILRAVNDLLAAKGSPDRLIHSNLKAFVDALRASAPRNADGSFALPEITGELRADRGSMVLAGTLSSRLYLKKENWKSQIALEKWAEPLSVWAWRCGGVYDQGLLTYAWKLLMQNHPHDSICGCSVDEVHAEMLPRFWQVQQVAEEVIERSIKHLAAKINTGTGDGEVPAAALLILNPLAFARTEQVEAIVEFPLGPTRRSGVAPAVDVAQGGKDVRQVQVTNPDGTLVPAQILETSLETRQVLSPIELPQVQNVRRMRLLFPAQDVPACGYATFRIQADSETQPATEALAPALNVLENASLRVFIAPNGSLTITHKDSGQEYEGLLVFEDGGDCGDEYRYIPPRRDQIFTTQSAAPRISLVEAGPVRATYRIEHLLWLPADGAARQRGSAFVAGSDSEPAQAPVRVISWVSLGVESQRVEVTTEIDNQARDHRLRVLFPTGARTNVAHAEGQFDVLTRSLALPAEWRGGSPFRPQQSFVDVSDGQRGIAVFNQGLPEYEGKTDVDRTIALTLVRGVGHLSDADAPGSPETPGAQCLGRQVCRYAIYPHAGSWEEADVWQQAHAFNTPVRCVQTTEHPGELPANASLLELRPNNLVLSAVKRAEDEEAVIVRFYNPAAAPAEGDLRLHFPVTAAYRANLNEERGEALPLSDDGRRIHVTARGKEIVTLLLLP